MFRLVTRQFVANVSRYGSPNLRECQRWVVNADRPDPSLPPVGGSSVASHGTLTGLNKDEETESKLISTILKLEEIDKNLFRANHSWKTSTKRVFGGQIIGQALVAASKTVPEHLHVHSMHCYFLLKGHLERPIIYRVENMRDGASISTRIVNAVQDGETIFTATASFHKHEEALASHQFQMPTVPPPEDLVIYEDLLDQAMRSNAVHKLQKKFIKAHLESEHSFLIKPINPSSFMLLRPPEPQEAKMLFWAKLKGGIGESSDSMHRCAVAYVSDSFLLLTALLPLSMHQCIPSMMASLDHVLWFHTQFNSDDWMLYECEAPRLIGNRGLTFGRIWRRDGVLAVSCAQEGVIRLMSTI